MPYKNKTDIFKCFFMSRVSTNYQRWGAQDIHPLFHTAPELRTFIWFYMPNKFKIIRTFFWFFLIWRCTCLIDTYGDVPVWLTYMVVYLSDCCKRRCTCLTDVYGSVPVWLMQMELYLSDWSIQRCTCLIDTNGDVPVLHGDIPVLMMYMEKVYLSDWCILRRWPGWSVWQETGTGTAAAWYALLLLPLTRSSPDTLAAPVVLMLWLKSHHATVQLFGIQLRPNSQSASWC